MCYVHIYGWPLNDLWSLNRYRQSFGQKLKFSQNDLTHPRAKFQLPTSFSSWDIRLVLFIEKWAWPNNYLPRPLKMIWCCTVPQSRPTHQISNRSVWRLLRKTWQKFCPKKRRKNWSLNDLWSLNHLCRHLCLLTKVSRNDIKYPYTKFQPRHI